MFTLTGLAAVDMGTTSTYNFDLAVTVAQTGPDGSDFQESGATATTEFHQFPQSIYVELSGAAGNYGPFAATLVTAGVPGITYSKNAAPGTTVSSTADYYVAMPASVPMADFTLSLYSSNVQGDTMTFRMGPSADLSWGDDIVGGTTSVTAAVALVCPP
jgi:hypothetical protein